MTGADLHWLHLVVLQAYVRTWGASWGGTMWDWGRWGRRGVALGSCTLPRGVCGQFSSEVSTGPRLQLPADVLVAPFVSYKLALNPRGNRPMSARPPLPTVVVAATQNVRIQNQTGQSISVTHSPARLGIPVSSEHLH